MSYNQNNYDNLPEAPINVQFEKLIKEVHTGGWKEPTLTEEQTRAKDAIITALEKGPLKQEVYQLDLNTLFPERLFYYTDNVNKKEAEYKRLMIVLFLDKYKIRNEVYPITEIILPPKAPSSIPPPPAAANTAPPISVRRKEYNQLVNNVKAQKLIDILGATGTYNWLHQNSMTFLAEYGFDFNKLTKPVDGAWFTNNRDILFNEINDFGINPLIEKLYGERYVQSNLTRRKKNRKFIPEDRTKYMNALKSIVENEYPYNQEDYIQVMHAGARRSRGKSHRKARKSRKNKKTRSK